VALGGGSPDVCPAITTVAHGWAACMAMEKSRHGGGTGNAPCFLRAIMAEARAHRPITWAIIGAICKRRGLQLSRSTSSARLARRNGKRLVRADALRSPLSMDGLCSAGRRGA